MRGRFTDQGGLFSYIAPDKRVPANHPLRKVVRELVRDVLGDLNRSLGRLAADFLLNLIAYNLIRIDKALGIDHGAATDQGVDDRKLRYAASHGLRPVAGLVGDGVEQRECPG